MVRQIMHARGRSAQRLRICLAQRVSDRVFRIIGGHAQVSIQASVPDTTRAEAERLLLYAIKLPLRQFCFPSSKA